MSNLKACKDISVANETSDLLTFHQKKIKGKDTHKDKTLLYSLLRPVVLLFSIVAVITYYIQH